MVKWEYNEGEDDDVRIKACRFFMSGDSFVKTKEFREFSYNSNWERHK